MQGPPQQYDAGLAGLGHSWRLLHMQTPQKDLSGRPAGSSAGTGLGRGPALLLSASPGVRGAG